MTGLQQPDTSAERARIVEAVAKLFSRSSGRQERIQAIRHFGEAVRSQIRDMSRVTDQGAEILTAAVNQLPIRSPDALRAAYGPNDDAVAAGVIDDAAALVGWLWTGAAVVPGPPPLVHAVKVIGHSAIEIRMIGELFALYGDPDWQRDAQWFNALLATWAVGRPVAVSAVTIGGARDITAKVRQSFVDLVSADSRVSGVAHRGREGADAVRSLGARIHRRMRLHPQMWDRLSDESVAAVLRQSVTRSVAGRIPIPRRDHDVLSTPAAHLRQAWQLHEKARGGAEATDTPGEVLDRLRSALTAQHSHLMFLSRELREPGPPSPALAFGDGLPLANELARRAEDAIHLTEEAASRPRRLASWPPRRRNILVYAMTALVVSSPVVAAVASGAVTSWIAVVGLLVGQSVALPCLTVAVGSFTIGRLFRPYLGGRVQRSLVVGALTAFVTHLVIAVVTGVLTTAGG